MDRIDELRRKRRSLREKISRRLATIDLMRDEVRTMTTAMRLVEHQIKEATDGRSETPGPVSQR